MESIRAQEDLARTRKATIMAMGRVVTDNLSGIGIGRQQTEEGAVPCLMVNGFTDYPEEVKTQITEAAAPVPVTFGYTGQIQAQNL